jgi:hypothetical protein
VAAGRQNDGGSSAIRRYADTFLSRPPEATDTDTDTDTDTGWHWLALARNFPTNPGLSQSVHLHIFDEWT